jgi:hypothetical protein
MFQNIWNQFHSQILLIHLLTIHISLSHLHLLMNHQLALSKLLRGETLLAFRRLDQPILSLFQVLQTLTQMLI